MSTSTAVELRPSPPDLTETFDRILGFRERFDAIATEAVRGGLRTVFFVGCGGSFLAAYPVVFLLQSRTAAFDVQHLTSAEFVSRRPPALGPDSLVVAGSHTGGTKETIAAVELAKEAGARVVGYSFNPESALAGAAPEFFAYGSRTTTGDAKQLVMALFGWSLLKAAGYRADYAAIDALYRNLAPALLDVHDQVAERFADIAARYHAEPISYVLGSGPGYAAAYNLSMCFFQEMQWMHSASFNAGEFFHGAFEVVQSDTAVYVLLGEDATRPLGERAVSFLRRYTDKLVVLDTAELALPGIDPAYRDLATPHVLITLSIRLAAHFAQASGHDLSVRRYMGKVAY